jgi:hypothetical protein
MSKQAIRTALLLLPLMAVSASAYAGATISDKRYWPNEARQSAYQQGWGSAFASTAARPRFSVAPPADPGRRAWRYQGGPKSPFIQK